MKTTTKKDGVRIMDEHICPRQNSYDGGRRHVDPGEKVIDVSVRVRCTGSKSGNGTGDVEIHVGGSNKKYEVSEGSPMRNLIRKLISLF